MRIALAAVPLLMATLLRAATPTLEAPPGWKDIQHEGKIQNAVIALKGPETSSFIVKLALGAPLDNPAGIRGFLNDVLGGVREGSRNDYRSNGRIETRVFKNGLTVHMLRAQLNGEDRLILGLFGVGNVPHISVLTSAAPEAMTASLFGAIEVGKVDGAIQTNGTARSTDGQLELELGGGRRARGLLDNEAVKGFVLVIQGGGSEILFQKLAEADATKPGEQAAIARELAAASANVPKEKASSVMSAPTAAGPVGVYAWAPTANGEKVSVGYLPWGYWGYQLFGRGPAADELLVGTLAALKAGPSAVPGLLASTPRIPIEKELPVKKIALGATAVAAALGAVGLLAWSAKRKNANLPS